VLMVMAGVAVFEPRRRAGGGTTDGLKNRLLEDGRLENRPHLFPSQTDVLKAGVIRQRGEPSAGAPFPIQQADLRVTLGCFPGFVPARARFSLSHPCSFRRVRPRLETTGGLSGAHRAATWCSSRDGRGRRHSHQRARRHHHRPCQRRCAGRLRVAPDDSAGQRRAAMIWSRARSAPVWRSVVEGGGGNDNDPGRRW
jgi:hypothetical protein